VVGDRDGTLRGESAAGAEAAGGHAAGRHERAVGGAVVDDERISVRALEIVYAEPTENTGKVVERTRKIRRCTGGALLALRIRCRA
jgi:hypothetical protein